MARKIKSKKTTTTSIVENYNKLIPTTGSYASLLYGVLTVLVLFAILFLAMQLFSQRKGEVSRNAAKTQQITETQNKIYTVQEGDSLWKISENVYEDGYAWSDIAKANNISNPNQIEKGMRLTLPPMAKKVDNIVLTPKTTVTPMPSMDKVQKITSNSYKVVAGDDLWDIAVRAYGDGYAWTKIAKANNLVNPNVIHSGNVFKLPR